MFCFIYVFLCFFSSNSSERNEEKSSDPDEHAVLVWHVCLHFNVDVSIVHTVQYFHKIFCVFCVFCCFQVQEKRLEAAREEERMLEMQRQYDEERGPGLDKTTVNAVAKDIGENNKDQSIRFMFNFSASEQIPKINPFKGTYTYYDAEEKKVILLWCCYL